MTLERKFELAIISYLDHLRDDLVSLDSEEGINNEEYESLVNDSGYIVTCLMCALTDILEKKIYKLRGETIE